MNKQILIVGIFLVVFGCEPKINDSGIPNIDVNIEINLTEIDMLPLKQINGYVYVAGGVRGVLIYHESVNVYRAFDRNCPFQPADACAVVEMHSSGFYIEDICCKSTFDLSGFPTGGPAQYPLKEYRTSLSGDFLFIFN